MVLFCFCYVVTITCVFIPYVIVSCLTYPRSYSRTYNAAFILSIVIGLGVGEMIFGRYIGAAAIH